MAPPKASSSVLFSTAVRMSGKGRTVARPQRICCALFNQSNTGVAPGSILCCSRYSSASPSHSTVAGVSAPTAAASTRRKALAEAT